MADAAPARGHALQRLVLWLVIAALFAAVWWLASERNERHYLLTTQNGELVVEKGRFFPMGTARAQEKIYAPVAVPRDEKGPQEVEYDDQNELDRALVGIFAGWARDAAKKGDPASMQLAGQLTARASALPGLSAAQLTELSALRADLAWDEARNDLQLAKQSVDEALRKLELVRQQNGPRAVEAAALQARLGGVSAALGELAKK